MNAFQGGFIYQIFSPQGSKPLENLRAAGNVQKGYEKACRSQVVVLSGTGAKIRVPKATKGPGSPGLFIQPILGLQLYVPHTAAALNLEVVLVDSFGSRRIFFSSSFTSEEIHPQHVKIPTSNFPRDIWVDLLLDVRSIHSRLYESRASVGFKGIESIEVSGSLRVRKIYTMRELSEGSPDEIPAVFAFPADLPSACVVMVKGDEMIPPPAAGLMRVPSAPLSAGRWNNGNNTPSSNATPPSSRTGKAKSAAGPGAPRSTPEGRMGPVAAAAGGGAGSAKKRHLDAMLAMHHHQPQQLGGTNSNFDGPQELDATSKPPQQRQSTVYTASQIEQLLLMRKRMLARQQQQHQHQEQQNHRGIVVGDVAEAGGVQFIPTPSPEMLPDIASSFREAARTTAATLSSASVNSHPMRPSLHSSTRGIGHGSVHARLPIERSTDGYASLPIPETLESAHLHHQQQLDLRQTEGTTTTIIEMPGEDDDEGDFHHRSIVSVHDQLQPPTDDDEEYEEEADEDEGGWRNRQGHNEGDDSDLAFVVQHNNSLLQHHHQHQPKHNEQLIPSVEFDSLRGGADANHISCQGHHGAGIGHYGVLDTTRDDDDEEEEELDGKVGARNHNVQLAFNSRDPNASIHTASSSMVMPTGSFLDECDSSAMRMAMENAARQLILNDSASAMYVSQQQQQHIQLRGGGGGGGGGGGPPVVLCTPIMQEAAISPDAKGARSTDGIAHDPNRSANFSQRVERSVQPSVRDSHRSCIFYRVRADSLPRYHTTESDTGNEDDTDNEARSDAAVVGTDETAHEAATTATTTTGTTSSNDLVDAADNGHRALDMSVSPVIHKLVLSELDASPLEANRLSSDPLRYEYDPVVGCFFDRVTCRFVRMAGAPPTLASDQPHPQLLESVPERGYSAGTTTRPTSTKLF